MESIQRLLMEALEGNEKAKIELIHLAIRKQDKSILTPLEPLDLSYNRDLLFKVAEIGWYNRFLDYHKRLGLDPPEIFKKESEKKAEQKGYPLRRTGRTTRMLLRCLALMENGLKPVRIIGHSFPFTSDLVRQIYFYANQLKIKIPPYQIKIGPLLKRDPMDGGAFDFLDYNPP